MTKARKVYDEEFKEKAINLLRSGDRSTADIAEELGISKSTLLRWNRQNIKEETKVSKKEADLSVGEAADRTINKRESSIGSPSEPSKPVTADSAREQIEITVANSSNSGDGQWKQIAVFHVTYQKRARKGKADEQRTKIEYHETDKFHHWEHIETEGIGQWIVEQAGEELQPEAEAVFEEVGPEPEVATRLSVTITHLHLNQPLGTVVPLRSGKTGRPQFGVVRANLPFAVITDIELNEEKAVNGKREVPYQAQFYARNRQTGESIQLGSAEPGLLVSGAVASASLTRIELPPGRYRLQALVEAGGENVAPGFCEVPLLEAV